MMAAEENKRAIALEVTKNTPGAKLMQSAKSKEVFKNEYGKLEDVIHANQAFCILGPTSQFRITWDLGLMFLLGYIAVMTPFRIGFSRDASGPMFWVENTMDMIFIVDVFLNFRTGFIDDQNLVVMDSKRISRAYLRGWFTLDVASGIPFDLIELGMSSDTGGLSNLRAAKLLKTGRLLKTFKILRITKLTKTLKAGILSESMDEFMTSTSNRSLLRLLKLAGMTFFAAHWSCCVWVYVGDGAEALEGTSWWSVYTDFVCNILSTPGPDCRPNKYLMGMYYVTAALTTVGYGDVVPITNNERAVAIVLMCLGSICYSFIIASMASIVTTADANESQLNIKMDCVTSFMNKHDFPPTLFRQVRRYYKHYYSQRTALDETEILDELSLRLQIDVSKFLIGEVMETCPIFHSIDPTAWPRILPVFNFIEFMPMEVVYNPGDAGREMFIVQDGKLVQLAEDEQPREINEGEYVGSLQLLDIHQYRHDKLFTPQGCKCFIISRDSLKKRLEKYPEIMEKLQLKAVADIYGSHTTVEEAMEHEHHVVAGLTLEDADDGTGETQATVEDMSENLNRRRKSMGLKSTSDQPMGPGSLDTVEEKFNSLGKDVNKLKDALNDLCARLDRAAELMT